MNNPEGELKPPSLEKIDSWYKLAQTMQSWFPQENHQAKISFLGNDAYRWAASRTKTKLDYGSIYINNLLLATSEQLIIPGFSEQDFWSITPLIHKGNNQEDKLFFYTTFPHHFSPADLYSSGYFITSYYRFAAQYENILRDAKPEELFMDICYLYQEATDSQPKIARFFSEMKKYKLHKHREQDSYYYKTDAEIDGTNE